VTGETEKLEAMSDEELSLRLNELGKIRDRTVTEMRAIVEIRMRRAAHARVRDQVKHLAPDDPVRQQVEEALGKP
jgi:hypothetical protein